MPQQFVAPSDMTVQIPWLGPLNVILRQAQMEGDLSVFKVPAGTDVYIDEISSRARLIFPNGRIRAWESLVEVDVIPQSPSSWDVSWNELGAGKKPGFGFVKDGDDYEISLEAFEGREDELFPEFVRLIRDPFLNPLGFPVPDGCYPSNMGVDFQVKFGMDGGTPSIVADEETISAQPAFPYETIIAFESDTQIFNVSEKKHGVVPAGAYTGKVKAWHGTTGNVAEIAYKGSKANFSIDGKQLVELIYGGQVQLVEVLQDEMPNY